uniref:H(+)-transporting two-sector ATPase n=1 Tax=Seculamonas ecuadoriensis TaxID=221724 RepID=M4QAS5_SECEC|nr:ATP synthase F0 subunit 8 [Seculamonas ecuadoriensis]AGH24472.1 ATP synthase F0 subunit 8 [Seculamonas ecuadoriensis]
MPQLDKVTYFSQFFWLLVFFLSFYVICLKIILPSISTILKIRTKKIDSMSSEMNVLKEEQNSILSTYDTVLLQSFSESRKALQTVISQSNDWMVSSIRNVNSTSFANANHSYLSTINDINKEKLAFSKIDNLVKE